MRRFAATALVLCGCNQIYGLDPTRMRDAAPDARNSEVRLSMLFGQSTLAASESPPFLAAVPDPRVKLALLTEPLAPVDYVPDDMSGVVPYPFALVREDWRLEYTPPLGVPHEIQWSPAEATGHLVVPVVGRLEQTAPPASTGYTLSMKTIGTTLYSFSPNTVVYTAGYWSSAPSPFQTLTPTIDFSTAAPLAGGRGIPLPTPGDVVVAIDYIAQGKCSRVASISGSARATPLTDGMMTPLELARFSESEAVELSYENETAVQAASRLAAVLGPRDGSQTSRVIFGRAAHTGMPFTTSIVAGVPGPVMIPLAECDPDTTTFTTNHAGGGLSFIRAAYLYAANERTVGSGVQLRSSIAAIGTILNGTTGKYEISTHVPFATTVRFGARALDTDGVQVGGDIGDLTFEFETDSRFVAHYYDVTLYKLTIGALEPVRTLVGIDLSTPKIRFDPSMMTATDEYVFAIRVHRGRPNALVGDLRTIQGPQAVSTVFTSTFRR